MCGIYGMETKQESESPGEELERLWSRVLDLRSTSNDEIDKHFAQNIERSTIYSHSKPQKASYWSFYTVLVVSGGKKYFCRCCGVEIPKQQRSFNKAFSQHSQFCINSLLNKEVPSLSLPIPKLFVGPYNLGQGDAPAQPPPTQHKVKSSTFVPKYAESGGEGVKREFSQEFSQEFASQSAEPAASSRYTTSEPEKDMDNFYDILGNLVFSLGYDPSLFESGSTPDILKYLMQGDPELNQITLQRVKLKQQEVAQNIKQTLSTRGLVNNFGIPLVFTVVVDAWCDSLSISDKSVGIYLAGLNGAERLCQHVVSPIVSNFCAKNLENALTKRLQTVFTPEEMKQLVHYVPAFVSTNRYDVRTAGRLIGFEHMRCTRHSLNTTFGYVLQQGFKKTPMNRRTMREMRQRRDKILQMLDTNVVIDSAVNSEKDQVLTDEEKMKQSHPMPRNGCDTFGRESSQRKLYEEDDFDEFQYNSYEDFCWRDGDVKDEGDASEEGHRERRQRDLNKVVEILDHLNGFVSTEEVESSSTSCYKNLFLNRLKPGMFLKLLSDFSGVIQRKEIHLRYVNLCLITEKERKTLMESAEHTFIQAFEDFFQQFDNASEEDWNAQVNLEKTPNLQSPRDAKKWREEEYECFYRNTGEFFDSLFNHSLAKFTLSTWECLVHMIRNKEVLMRPDLLARILNNTSKILEMDENFHLWYFLTQNPITWDMICALHFVVGMLIRTSTVLEQDNPSHIASCISLIYRFLVDLLNAEQLIREEWDNVNSLYRNPYGNIDNIAGFVYDLSLQIGIEASQHLGYMINFDRVVRAIEAKMSMIDAPTHSNEPVQAMISQYWGIVGAMHYEQICFMAAVAFYPTAHNYSFAFLVQIYDSLQAVCGTSKSKILILDKLLGERDGLKIAVERGHLHNLSICCVAWLVERLIPTTDSWKPNSRYWPRENLIPPEDMPQIDKKLWLLELKKARIKTVLADIMKDIHGLTSIELESYEEEMLANGELLAWWERRGLVNQLYNLGFALRVVFSHPLSVKFVKQTLGPKEAAD